MHLLEYPRRSQRIYGIIAIAFIFTLFINSVATDAINVENTVSGNEDADSINKHLGQDNANNVYFYHNEDKSTEILSRKRRYLTFPSGSSFQLVYDLIVGVVDYTNYLILGVTSALAWQLPSEAPSEIIENLRTKLKSGTIDVSRNDSIENIQYIDTKPKQTQNYYEKPAPITTFTNPQSYSYYNSNQFHPPMDTKYYSSRPVYYSKPSGNFLSRTHDTDYYSTRQNPLTEWKDSKLRRVSLSAPITSNTLSSKISKWWNGNKRNRIYKKPEYIRKHRIYPVFAKRSVDAHNRQKRHGIAGPSLTKIDEIHLRHHRSTRQDLYKKIEKYLETHNKNGHQCVLKALCETGQKANEVQPGTFVGEIMRSIFTMPESEDPVYNYNHKIYDQAHAHDGNCTEKYPLCLDSVWKADFVL